MSAPCSANIFRSVKARNCWLWPTVVGRFTYELERIVLKSQLCFQGPDLPVENS